MSASGECVDPATGAGPLPAWTVSQFHAGLDAALANAGMRQLWVTFPCVTLSQPARRPASPIATVAVFSL